MKNLLLCTILLSCTTGVVMGQSISVENTSKYIGAGRYSWTVFVKAGPSAMASIEKVQYTLHPTFKEPLVWGTGPTFSYSAVGWGEFNIVATIFYKDKRKPTTISHWLHLFSPQR